MNAALFVGQSAANMRLPPCVKIEIKNHEESNQISSAPKQRIEVLHLFRWSTHLLAQKCLIELLMWNASDVQKTLQLNLTGNSE